MSQRRRSSSSSPSPSSSSSIWTLYQFTISYFVCFFLCSCYSAPNVKQPSKVSSDISIVPAGYQYKQLGSSLIFTCIVGRGVVGPAVGKETGGGWPQIKWKDPNQALVVENQERIYTERIDAYKSRLYVTNIEEHDAGLYTCEAHTLDGLMLIASNNLFIFADIRLKSTTKQVEVMKGRNTLLECEAEGNPQPEVYWKFNNKKLTKEVKGHYEILRSGLRIRNVEIEDNGTYECRAQVMSQGNFKTTNIELNVLYAPILSLPIHSPTVLKGTDAKLTCHAQGNPNVVYQWFKGNPKSGQSLYSGTTGDYVIRKVSEDDEGEYTCVVRNLYGTQEGTADLRVSVPPRVKVPEEIITILEGKNFILPCEAVSSPMATFHWSRRHGNKTVSYFTHADVSKTSSAERFSVATSSAGVSRLKVKGAMRSDEGNYTCTAHNSAGSDSKDIRVVIDFLPTIYLKSDPEIYSWSGEERTLTCVAFGQPLPTIGWIKGVKTYLGSTPHHTITVQKEGPDSVSTKLRLVVDEQLETSMFANYTCMAKNSHGFDSKTVTVKRAYPPEVPRNVSVVNVTHDSFSLKTTENSHSAAFPPATTWIVKFKKTPSSAGISFHKMIEFSVKNYESDKPIVVNGLEADTEYLVLVSARNQVGESEPVKFDVKTGKFIFDELFQADEGLLSKSSLSRQEHLRLNKNAEILGTTRGSSFWGGLSVGLVVVVAGLLTVLTTVVVAVALRNWRQNLPAKSGRYKIGSPGIGLSTFDSSIRGKQVKVTDERDIDNLTLKTNRPATSVTDDSPFVDLQTRYGSLPRKFGESAKVVRPFELANNNNINNNLNNDNQQQQAEQNGGKMSWPLSSTLPRSRKMEVHVNRTASVMQMIEEKKTKQSQAWKEMLKLTTADLDEDSMVSKEDDDDDGENEENLRREDAQAEDDEGVFEEVQQQQQPNLPPPPSDMLISPVNARQFIMQAQPYLGTAVPVASNVNVRCKQGPFDASHIEDEDEISFIDDDDEEDDDVVITHHCVGNPATKRVHFEGKSFRQY